MIKLLDLMECKSLRDLIDKQAIELFEFFFFENDESEKELNKMAKRLSKKHFKKLSREMMKHVDQEVLMPNIIRATKLRLKICDNLLKKAEAIYNEE